MKTLKQLRTIRLTRLLAIWLVLMPLLLHALPFGQWDFNQSNLVATVGSALSYLDGPGGVTETETRFGLTSDFGLPPIGGVHARVMAFPAAVEPKGFLIATPPANGGDTRVNEFTLIMDVLYPAASQAVYRRVLQLLTYAFTITAENGLGMLPDSSDHGLLTSETWYRLGWVMNCSETVVRFYINGVEVGYIESPSLSNDEGGSLPAMAAVALLCNQSGVLSAAGYVNSIQLWDKALNADEMAFLGGPSAHGLPVILPATLFSEDFEDVLLQPKVNEPNVDANLLGWTDTPPAGWIVNDSAMPGYGTGDGNDGRTEWAGWSFASKVFWLASDNQTRDQFTLGTGNLAIADPDEWDDEVHPRGVGDYFDSTIATPTFSIAGIELNSLTLKFDSSWRPEGFDDWGGALNNQTATITVSFNGESPIEVLRWDSQVGGQFYKLDALNEVVLIPLPHPAGATTAKISFRLSEAANDWWWAIDNIVVRGVPKLPPIQYSTDQVVLVFYGTPGLAYDVQRAESTTFPPSSWTTLTTSSPVSATADGLVIYKDLNPPLDGALYRIVPD